LALRKWGQHEQRLRLRLELSARCIRENDAVTAPRLITEDYRPSKGARTLTGGENGYLLKMREGFKAALAGMYAIAQRGEQ
jgi:hypothetical protein